MKIKFNEDELAVVYAAMSHIANSTNLMESYDPLHREQMPAGTFAESYYKAMTKINKVSNSNIERGVNYFSS